MLSHLSANGHIRRLKDDDDKIEGFEIYKTQRYQLYFADTLL